MIATLPLPTQLETGAGAVTLRAASTEDLEGLMKLLADDAIGRGRGDRAEGEDAERYRRALAEVLADGSNELVVGVQEDAPLLAMFQLTRIPGLSRRGVTRLQVESVRVAREARSRGLGAAMMRWVLEDAAPAVGAELVQLTSDAEREDARRFYERLGFVPSHIGFKANAAQS
ncbi:GNAT family N-acetyltransferase [Brachybacterium endophyticum]|uniref:GNAT family N-acetyltransferase n=1 Tax=Brachybacterium endophyticum TaxID=2182385 RepID=A0A2U2RJL0_9MICO|nr:GNAT family N-acetyltransferase [Brachybacterium endophyticum]PWH06058.1 GNAT family N-acetyltransferase [Brachybacterium endophyticum]